MEEIKKGYIYIPYIFINRSISINGTTVWYRNKLKNFLLKIKFIFTPIPKFPKNEIVNSKYYQEIPWRKK